MLTYITGDLFESPAKVLVNAVNTVGVMGKGIAKRFKAIYPEMFAEYQRHCESGEFEIGKLWVYKTKNKWILNFPTKRHWRAKSRLEDIEAGLLNFVRTYAELGMTSVAFPRLGCGNGQLDWSTQVRPLMEKYLKELPVEAFVYVHPRNELDVEQDNPKRMKQWLQSEPWSLAFSEVWDDLIAVVARDGSLSVRGELHKLTVGEREEADAGGSATVHCVPTVKAEGAHGAEFSKEDLLEVWQGFRETGFCQEQSAPRGVGKSFPTLVALLAELPYVVPVHLSNRQDLLGSESALQFAPGRMQRGQIQQRTLFDLAQR